MLENSKKRESFGNWVLILISISIWRFSQVFFFKHFIFSHLSYLFILSIRILFLVRKLVRGLLRSPRLFVVFEIIKSYNLLCVCCYPSCVEVIVEEFRLVGIPLSVEVIVGVLALSLIPQV